MWCQFAQVSGQAVDKTDVTIIVHYTAQNGDIRCFFIQGYFFDLLAGAFLTGAFLAEVFLIPDFWAADFLTAGFFAAGFLTEVFFAAVFFTPAFLLTAFFAAVFFATAFSYFSKPSYLNVFFHFSSFAVGFSTIVI